MANTPVNGNGEREKRGAVRFSPEKLLSREGIEYLERI
jgi:hypothetical protein